MPRRLPAVAALVAIALVLLPGLGRCWLLCSLQDVLAQDPVDTCCAQEEVPAAPAPVGPICACDDDLPPAVLPTLLDLPPVATLPDPTYPWSAATVRETVGAVPVLRARAPPGLAALRCVVLLI